MPRVQNKNTHNKQSPREKPAQNPPNHLPGQESRKPQLTDRRHLEDHSDVRRPHLTQIIKAVKAAVLKNASTVNYKFPGNKGKSRKSQQRNRRYIKQKKTKWKEYNYRNKKTHQTGSGRVEMMEPLSCRTHGRVHPI